MTTCCVKMAGEGRETGLLFRLFLALVVVGLFDLGASKQYTLNVPRVLLPRVPQSGVKSNFTLKSEYGCFNWLSTKPDVASVQPVYTQSKTGLKCSREAVLTPQSTESVRLSTIIIATEEATGLTLRCDVYVDNIFRIEITTRTRELLLEEEPEKFEVRAFDDEGNMFSTVRGHVFQWTLLKDEEGENQQLVPESILSFVEFRDSSYSVDPIISSLEEMGQQGDEVLVSGINTGTAKVCVRLAEKTWKLVSVDIVKLLVIENLMLLPSADVYIMPYSYVDYRVERRKHGKVEVVVMPSEQYTLELLNTTVASLDRAKSRVTGMIIGSTEIVLHDKNMLNIPHAAKPSADVHVVFPHHIDFEVLPGHHWVLEVGKEYVFFVHLKDPNNHKILITDNVPLATNVSSDYFIVHKSSGNGSYHHVTAVKAGKTYLNSSISHLKHPETGEKHPLPAPLSKKQLIEIFHPISVTPNVLLLLWDIRNEYQYRHQLKVTGGSGSYQWSSDNVDVVGVSSTGLVTTFSMGQANVTVSDTRNDNHYDTAKVYVVSPVEMSFLSSLVEVEVGSSLYLPLQVLGKTPEEPPLTLPFYDCRFMGFKFSLADDAIFNVSLDQNISLSSLPVDACTFIKATSLTPGHTKLTVTYTHGLLQLEASVTIASYHALRSIDPEEFALVTLGSSKTFIFEGGPSPWVLDPSKYFRKLVPEVPDDISIAPVPSSSLTQHVYIVLCRILGEQHLVFTAGNDPTSKNKFPADETIAIKFFCSIPVSLTVRPLVPEMTDCPLLREGNLATQFPVLNKGLLTLEVIVYDKERHRFDNFSSLQWAWTSSDTKLLPLTAPTTQLAHHGNRAVLSVVLSRSSGSVSVSLSSNSHQPEAIAAAQAANFQDPFPPVKSSLSLLLRSQAVLDPDTALVYSHPSNRFILSVLHGSSFFYVDHVIKPRPPVADVEYIKELHQINILPIGEGHVLISVKDLCLPGDPLSGVVHVSSVQFIRVRAPDKVQVGNTIIAYVRLMDIRKEMFSSNQHWLMKLQPNLKTDNIELKPATDAFIKTLPVNETSVSSVFIIRGVSMGTAVLLFNATTTTGKVISSPPVEIQVFDALKLDPTNITLLPTATYQVISSGGPHHQTDIVYSVDKDYIATVDHGGLIKAVAPGLAIVTGKAQSIDVSFGSPFIYSSDTVNVRVVQLKGVRIVIPSTTLITGEEVSVYVEGSGDGETPFSFASSVPGLTFYWSVSNMDVMSLLSVYDNAGISLENEKDFAARLRTRNPGWGSIKVTVRCPPGLCTPEETSFSDEVTLTVFARLRLITPSDSHFLLPHNGHARIITNRDGVSDISYELVRGCSFDEGEPVVTLLPSGDIFTAGFNGHAVVMVTAHETDLRLNQSLIIHVEVRPLDSLSLMSLSPAKAVLHSKKHAFPLGYSAHFVARLHDAVGRSFDYANIDLSYRLNRLDIVHITRGMGNDSYIVKAARQGNAILKVWVKGSPHISDYVRVTVSYAIIPSLATVHLGAKICFTTHLTEDHPDSWETGGKGVIELEESSGIAKAIGTGRAVVYHKVEGMVDTHTEISVATIGRIVFNITSSLPVFTNSRRPGNLGPYLVPVEFKDEHNDSDLTLLQASTARGCLNDSSSRECLEDRETIPLSYLQQVYFDCYLELRKDGNALPTSNYIVAKPLFDPLTGSSACQLFEADIKDEEGSHTLSAMPDLSLGLRVKARDFDSSYEVWSERLSVPFLPAFSIDATNVSLTSLQHSVPLTISGVQHVLQTIQVSCPHPFVLTQQSLAATVLVYTVSLANTYSPPTQNITDVVVQISSSLTHQRVVLTLSYLILSESMDPVSCPVQNQTNATQLNLIQDLYKRWNLVFVVVTTVVMFLVTIVVCIAIRQSSSSRPPTGFAAHLPPTSPSQPTTPAFSSSQTTPTRHTQFSTPLWSQSAGGTGGGQSSAFKRTTAGGGSGGGGTKYPHHSPNRASPQYSMFSQ